jgi:hypothetical protein
VGRVARIWSGAVVAGSFLLIGVGSLVVYAISSASGINAFLSAPVEPAQATADILDVDPEGSPGGLTYVDISYTTDSGEVVVTYVEWRSSGDAKVGDTMPIVYDRTDTEYAFDANDPVVSSGDTGAGSGESGGGPSRVPLLVAAISTSVALILGALTVPWALAAKPRPTTDTAAAQGWPPIGAPLYSPITGPVVPGATPAAPPAASETWFEPS